jgi:hypothetical protein
MHRCHLSSGGIGPLRCDCVGNLYGGWSRQAPWAGGGGHLGRGVVPRCSVLHEGEHEGGGGGGCFCGGVFLSGVDFFGGRCGSWLQKATAATAIVVPVLRSR